MDTNTYFIATKFWGATRASVKQVSDLASAVSAFNANRARKGVERVLVGTDATLNSGIVLDSWHRA